MERAGGLDPSGGGSSSSTTTTTTTTTATAASSVGFKKADDEKGCGELLC